MKPRKDQNNLNFIGNQISVWIEMLRMEIIELSL